ncbi:PKD domain-containing protein [Flagellimonas sp. GZD32]|uniref:PKD domain-containing protein n=1 Tax=Flagellimonas cixiensis TaxID=3228750 RepID=UPI0035C8EC31
MKKNYFGGVFLIQALIFTFSVQIFSQNFSQSLLDMNGLGSISDGVTSIMYGPDGRLYVTEYSGAINILTVQRNGAGDYIVTDAEVLDGILTMEDHNDDGSLHESTERETLGFTVTGTATNPVIYVTSSDFRIAAGTGNGDIGLDTNSGVITRFSWNGNSWDVVDIVRGLPRSEENHATLGLEHVNIGGVEYLIVSQGGHTNAGSPSNNFVHTCEYALSAAILSVNLDMIEALPILNDNGRSYIYDLPTLDDPTRPNVNGIIDPDLPGYDGIDVNDPWGGNDGLNQAMLVPNGPVQIFSPGYRNAYDIVVTESGAVYATDNGANLGWGGLPMNEGGGSVTNDYDPTEPGSTERTLYLERVNNRDHLELITIDMQNYVFGSTYAGHPNPIRANPSGAGLYTAPDPNNTDGAVFRTLIYDPSNPGPGFTDDPNIALPANWPPYPVAQANPIEGDFQNGDTNNEGPTDNPVTYWGTNTNGIDEYTASNFGGVMQGNLLAGVNNGVLRRVELNPDGSLNTLTSEFLSGIGGNPLGVTCNSDTEIFPGTIWVGTFNGNIVVFEPQDFVTCLSPGDPGYDANADNDADGYTNQDELDNGTDPCNGGSQPADFDKSGGSPLISDLNDPDDDNDGIPDALDPFQLGNPNLGGSDAFSIPINNGLFNDQQGLGGIFGLGMTGLMNNGDTEANWMNWIDRRDDPNDPNPNDVLGGAPGLMTSHMTSGTALGTQNNQEKGYQFGIKTESSTGEFTVVGNVINLFGGSYRLYDNVDAPNGELGLFIGDGTQSNYIKFVITKNGLQALQEINDIPQTPVELTILESERPLDEILFHFKVNAVTGEVSLEYSIDNGPRLILGSITAEGSILTAIQQPEIDLAVGFIGTSGATGVELEGTWDYLAVLTESPTIAQEIGSFQRQVGTTDEVFNLDDYFTDDNGVANLTYTIENNTNINIGSSINGNLMTLSYPIAPNSSEITVRATDEDLNFVELTFLVEVIEASGILYRINTGGPAIPSIDGEILWEEDTVSNNSSYLIQPATNNSYNSTINNFSDDVDLTKVPTAIFETERYDATGGEPNMLYSFPVTESGNYEVKLYMGNGYSETSESGQRIFDVSIEGIILPELKSIDLSGSYGHSTGVAISHIIEVTDGSIDIEFMHGAVQNPLINAIEILDAPDNNTPIYVNSIPDQFGAAGIQLDGSLSVQATGGDGNLQYLAEGLPPGLTIEPTNGQIGGTIDETVLDGTSFTVTITVDDTDDIVDDAVALNFSWTVSNTTSTADLWMDKDEDENYTARHELSFVQAGDKFYLMGGRENATSIDVYDYANNSWTEITNVTPTVNGTQLEFNHFQATEYNGLIWVIAAFKTNDFPNEVPTEYIWIFDPTVNQWIQGPAIPENRRRGSAGLVQYNDKFYIIAGNSIGHNGGYVDWFDEYDPATGQWTVLPNSPRPRDHFHAAVVGDKLYAVGGRLSGGTGGTFAPTIPEVDVYDFLTGTWETLPVSDNIPTPRGAPSVSVFNGKLVVAGGEVENQIVYGVNTTDALKVVEEYNPLTNEWRRLADLNHERHGTQSIVSGDGIFLLGGSPNKGGGNQKNMEYYGTDNPQGVSSLASTLSAPTTIAVAEGEIVDVDLSAIDGNVGIFVTSMEISGTDAADFNLVSGELTNGLIKFNGTHTLSVSLSGTGSDRTAILTVNYGNSQTLDIVLTENPNTTISITNPGDQQNYEGDSVSLQIEATSPNAITYSALGLPPNLTIDENTGVISGTVEQGFVGGGSNAFVEENGLVVIEAESFDINSNWTMESTEDGYLGTGYLFNHVDSFNTPGNGTITEQILISTPGKYRFQWRNNIGIIDASSPTTEHNDAWLRFPDADDFYGEKSNGNIVYPFGSGKTPNPNGAGANGWFKVYANTLNWNWTANVSDNDPHQIYVEFDEPGIYTLEISSRSEGHLIDRIALHLVSEGYTLTDLNNASESNRDAGNVQGAAENSPYSVSVSVTDNGEPIGNETIEFMWFINIFNQSPVANATSDVVSGDVPLEVSFTGSGSTDDIGITSYSWDFGDGSSVSNEADPVHTYTVAGTYEAVLTVFDGQGQTDTDMVNITVVEPGTAGVISFTLVDAATDTDLFDLFDGQQIDLGVSGGQSLNIRANATSETSSVSFNMTGPLSATKTEGVAPYALFGDKSGNYNPMDLPLGSYTLTASATSGGVTLGQPLTIQFSIVTGTDQSPVANATSDVVSGDVPLEVSFTGSGSTDDIGITSYSWDFGDGSSVSNEADPVHTYTVAGTYEAVLTVFDGQGQTDTDMVNISVNQVQDQSPVANATSDVVSGDVPLEVSFTGSGSTDDIGITSYSWDFGDGSSVSNEADPVHTYTVAGTYEAVLTVLDGQGQTDIDMVNITVNQVQDQSPVANATSDVVSGDVPLEVSFTGSGSTDDIGITSYSWDFGDGSSVSNEADPVHTYTVAGTYEAVLTVFDGQGQTDTDMVNITVVEPGTAGVISFTLVDAATDTDLFDLFDGQQIDLGVSGGQSLNIRANATSETSSVSFNMTGPLSATKTEGVAPYALFGDKSGNYNPMDLPLGSYTLTASATSGGVTLGQPLTIQFSIVTGTDQSPVANATSDVVSGDVPLEVSFTGSGSTDDIGITSYSWDFGDGSSVSNEADPVHTYTVAGTYEAVLTVFDGQGQTDTDMVNITVNQVQDQSPVANATSDVVSGDVPLEVSFTGSGSTDDIGITSYSWDFGDGSSVSNEADPVHTYTVAGTYEAVLTVFDGQGQTDTDMVNITVVEPGTAGVISFTLVDAATDTDLFDLFDGQQIDLGVSGGQSLNIRANATSETSSVSFNMTGPLSATKTEGVAPYALFGDKSGNYNPMDLPLGSYTLTASATSGGVTLGQPLTIQFSIVSGLASKGSETQNMEESLDSMGDVEEINPFDIILYPNPGATQVTISTRSLEANVMEIRIFDSTGQLVRSFNPTAYRDGNDYNLPVHSLQAGVYHIGVLTQEGRAFFKQMIVRK